MCVNSVIPKVKAWFTRNSRRIKTIFLISVVIIVLGEVMSISKTISGNQIKQLVMELGPLKVLVIILIGLIAVLPMIGYDVVLNRILGKDIDKLYLFETSWLINTINNLAGFGGFISVGLRSEFYGKEKDAKDVVQALSKILLYLMSGLSIYSLFSFFVLIFGPENEYLRQYWLWLIIGGLYFPVVLLAARFSKGHIFGGLDRKNQWQLIMYSFLEWSGVLIAFIAVGKIMGLSFDTIEIFPLFIAATVIGIVSMIPGALGSFDVMMLIGLSNIGIHRETAVVWILLFRLAYYFIPFLIGITFFLKNTTRSLNKRYSGIPKDLATEVLHKIEVFLLYFSGIMLVLSATIPEAFSQIQWLHRLNPFQLNLLVQYPSIILGYLLIITGRASSARVKKAYIPTILLVMLTFAYVIAAGFRLRTIVFIAILLFTVIISKRELYREQFVYSWEWLTIDGIIIGLLTVFYIIIGVYNLPHINHRHHRFSSFFLFPSEKLWVRGLAATAFVAALIFLYVRYLQGREHKIGKPVSDHQIQGILENYGGNTESQLVFLKDKSVYIYNDGEADTVFLQFKTLNNKVIVMGDPIGKKEDFTKAIEGFITEADRWNYLPVFYENNEEMVMDLHEFGYDFIKFGEEAHVDLSKFTLSGKKMKGQRAAFNKIEKQGFTFDVIKPPYSKETMAELKKISDEWLGGRREKGFSLGFFLESYLQRSDIAIVRDPDQNIVAFANFMPTYNDHDNTIDLMRYSPERLLEA